MAEEQQVQYELKDDSKTMALLNWLGCIFFGFIPPLVLFLVKKDDQFIQDHAKEALNFSINVFVAYVIASILMVVLIGLLLLPVIGIGALIICIMAAMKANNGEMYKVPFPIVRLIK